MKYKKREISIFALIIILYSWPIFFIVDGWLIPKYIDLDSIGTARIILVFGHMLAMLGPALAAFLLWRIFPKIHQPAWKWSQSRYYALVSIAAIAFWCLPGLIGLAFGDRFESPIEPSMWLMLGIYVTGGWFAGMGEEIGWCAFLLPFLSDKIGKARSMIFSGVFRGLWHLPVLVIPLLLQFQRGEKTLVELLLFSLVFAMQLAISNVFFGSVFGWIWYKTESMPLVGWLHFWYDLTRDATILLLVGYGSSLWATALNAIVFSGLGCWLMIKIGEEEGASINTFFKPPILNTQVE